jgi:hypothetical protein
VNAAVRQHKAGEIAGLKGGDSGRGRERERPVTICRGGFRHLDASKEPGAMREPELVRFEIEGAELAVRLAGDREKPALLLIHGFPSSSESFRNVIGTLARNCFLM